MVKNQIYHPHLSKSNFLSGKRSDVDDEMEMHNIIGQKKKQLQWDKDNKS